MADEFIEQQLDRIERMLGELLARSPGGPTPAPTPVPTPTDRRHPSELIPTLANWTIMRPTGKQGKPDNGYVRGQTIHGLYFVEDAAVVFRCPADGVHSENSKYARCEAREMADGEWTKAAWSSAGPRTLTAGLAIDTSGLVTRKRIVGAQIHDGSDDVIQVMVREDGVLGVMHDDGDTFEALKPDYRGEGFALRIAVAEHWMRVVVAGPDWNRGVDLPKRGTGWYFKAGCYLQTGGASEHVEPAGAYGEVRLTRLAVE